MSRSYRRAWLALGIFVAALCSIRALLHHTVEQRVIAALARNERYAGHFDDVDISLLRPSYSIEGLRLTKRDGQVPVPFAKAERVDYTLDPWELLHGHIRGAIRITRPTLNLVDGPTPELRQGPAGVDWRITMRKLFPTRLNHIEVRDGTIHFRNFHSEPQVDVYVENVQIKATNLAWRWTAARGEALGLHASGVPMKSGSIEGDVTLYRNTREPSFDCALAIEGAQLPEWNALLRAYLGVDVERGVARIDVDLRARDGEVHGTVTPALTHLRVLGAPSELVRQSALTTVEESVIDLVVFLLRDQRRDVITARVPISGTIHSPRSDDWESARLLVRDAVVEALKAVGDAVPAPDAS